VSYTSIVEMATNPSLRSRVAACAAEQNLADPDQWAADNMWWLAAQPGWAQDWDYAKDTYQINANPDLGARTDVIDDAQILAAVQARMTPA
jgi:hypothetical protein